MSRTSFKRTYSQMTEPLNESGTVSKYVSPAEESMASLGYPTNKLPIAESIAGVQFALQSLPSSIDKVARLNDLNSWRLRYNLAETSIAYPSKLQTAYIFSKCANILPDTSSAIGTIAAILDQLCDMPPQSFTNFRNALRFHPGMIERQCHDFGLSI